MKLELRSLQAAYGKIQVLWDVTLTVEAGQFVALIGANGAGKTTTLRAVSGLIPLKGGQMLLEGQDISRMPSAQRVQQGLGHVPEGRQLFPGMTVQENLELGAQVRTAAWQVKDQTLRRVYDLFPRLEERKSQLSGTLSGGEQQMVAIARAMMALPKVLLVDEPSLGLSPLLTKVVFSALKEINRQGVGVLLVEQNVRQSLQLADQAYVLENGQVVRSGSGQALLDDPEVQQAYLAF
ncbi:ABC transporter ATP-binding protein [Deinococcus cellulosilyticus]|uniref:ABC transporter ATP-binding protein n=1 Tax=Deinococcus cellulosilyticus (strain DSM 18568 / NBRC 106333 / KACC 11606 / 5516J-15) TaxID=1223518 RepID=A0A511N2T2_DEIC1|nr:ABC transporter ATP-binding protein [Deinococcus cellulosilyticus]GEM47159.1 ABC transporter ATP-binding protein [Deinococcus cellulosilyticus NBRC 106333 = KACC 11606]